MGAIQAVIGGISQASQYSAAKRQALMSGEAQKNAAYAKATASEKESKEALKLVGENLERMAGNRRRDMGKARAANAATGFSAEGSGGKLEEVANKVHTQQMADMARAGSTASMNALDEQIGLRRQGEAAMEAARIEAEQYAAMAKASRTGAWLSALGGVVGMAGGAVQGYQNAQAFNKLFAAPIKDGVLNAASLNKSAMLGGLFGADAGAGLLASSNPFTAAMAGSSWQRNLNGMLGIGKIY